MTPAYLAISILKKSNIPIDQLKKFLSYINEKALKEYLYISNICKGKKNLTTIELIDLKINGNENNNKDTRNETTIYEVNNILIDAQAYILLI